MRDTDLDWKGLAVNNPYHAVLTDEKWKDEINDEKRVSFLETGKGYINEAITSLGLKIPFKPKRALDFGCGVGRLMFNMATHVDEVVGIDVSPEMLKEANYNLSLVGVTNFKLIEANDVDIIQDEYDWINSYIVFQHIPQERGYQIFKKMIDNLAPGGGISVHFTFATDISNIAKKVANHRYVVSEGNHIKLISTTTNKVDDKPMMSMHDYDLARLSLMLAEAGLPRFLFRHTNHKGHHGVMIFARKNY